MSFPRYPAYKDSGVEWLGMVPEHWDAKPVKNLISRMESGTSVNATDDPADPGQFGVLKTSCVYTGQFRPGENKAVIQAEVGRVSCPLLSNSLIVSRMNTPDLVGAAGYVSHAPPNIYLPDRLWQVTFQAAAPKFIHYWTQSATYRAGIKTACSGTSSSMQNLGQDQFRSLPIATPPVTEQRVIAAFLDHETAKIDALIAEQQRLIELLNEKRQTVISHAVTKGLNSNVAMKPSGVEWLGDIPEHWSVKRVSTLFQMISSGTTPLSDGPGNYGGNIPWVTTGELRETIITSTEKSVTNFAIEKFSSLKVYPPGTLLVAMYGATIGRLGILGVSACTNQACCAFARPTGIVTDFAYFFFMAAKEFLLLMASGGGQPNINQEKLRALRVSAPPIEEQQDIVSYLRKHCGEILLLEEEATKGIQLLQERRSALISATVTGQIDVRGFASQVAA